MDTLDGIRTVIAVVETGSFTAATERLGMSKALVSKYVGEVESRLGVRLFNRSTRRLALTEAGKNYYQRALPLLEEFAQLVDSVATEQAQPQGLLRVSVPVTFGEMKLSPQLPTFLERYPQIQLDVQLTDRKIDMLEAGIDVVIRIGGVDDSSLIARQINSLPLVLCASPDYIKHHGNPQTPQQLCSHQCVIDSNFAIGKQWPLTSSKQVSESIEVQSRIAVNSPRAVQAIVEAGGGIGLIPRFIVEDALSNGTLQQVLPDYSTLSFGLFAIYPHRRYLPRKVRCFIDFLLETF
ncbi:MAG: DNA-binding transcriptional LysR family regulator [Phenylobacterium sp.]